MNMTKEQVQAAIAAGLALTSPESDLLEVFRKQASGVIILHQLLLAIGSGQVKLEAVEVPTPTPAPAPAPSKGPRPSRKKPARKKVRAKKKK